MSRESTKQVRPALTFLPREEDLLVLQELATAARGQILEQPFELTNKSSGARARYSLQAIIGRRAGEEFPTWYLYSGPDQDKLEWIHQTKEVDDITEMLAPLAEQEVQAEENQSSPGYGVSFSATTGNTTNSAANFNSENNTDTQALPYASSDFALPFGQALNPVPNSVPHSAPTPAPNPSPRASADKLQPFSPKSNPPAPGSLPTAALPQLGGLNFDNTLHDKPAQTPGTPYLTGGQAAINPHGSNSPESTGSNTPASPLEGDFARLSVESVLDSISRNLMTGCLKADFRGEPVLVYFESGVARHAQRGEFSGEDVLVELITAMEGPFTFASGEITHARTIFKRQEELVSRAATIIEYGTFLEKAGIRFNTVLKRSQVSPPEHELEDTLSRLLPVDFHTQKRFYSLADNQRSLQEIIHAGKFNRCQWIPTLYNFISSSILIRGEEKSPHGDESLGLDRSAIEQFARSHLYSDKGIINYLALLFFIEQEFYRYECFQSPFAIMIVRPRILRREGMREVEESLINADRRDLLLKRIKEVKRKADILAHYLQDDYALLLPQTSVQGVRAFAERLVRCIMQDENTPITNQSETVLLPPGEKLVLYVGVASLPDEAPDWVSLIAACQRQQRLFAPN